MAGVIPDVAELLVQLNAERKRQGLTVEAWCDRAGISRFTYYRAAERGSTSVHTLGCLAAVLGLELGLRPLQSRQAVA